MMTSLSMQMSTLRMGSSSAYGKTLQKCITGPCKSREQLLIHCLEIGNRCSIYIARKQILFILDKLSCNFFR